MVLKRRLSFDGHGKSFNASKGNGWVETWLVLHHNLRPDSDTWSVLLGKISTELLAVSLISTLIFHAFTSSLFPGSLDMQREAIEKRWSQRMELSQPMCLSCRIAALFHSFFINVCENSVCMSVFECHSLFEWLLNHRKIFGLYVYMKLACYGENTFYTCL